MGTERDAVGTEKEIWDLILNGKFTDDMAIYIYIYNTTNNTNNSDFSTIVMLARTMT